MRRWAQMNADGDRRKTEMKPKREVGVIHQSFRPFSRLQQLSPLCAFVASREAQSRSAPTPFALGPYPSAHKPESRH